MLAAWWLLEIKFDKISAFLTKAFNSYILRERQTSKIRVEVSQTVDTNEAAVTAAEGNQPQPQRRQLADMFGMIEAEKNVLGIQEYSISQTSLEQIFNQFAAQVRKKKGKSKQQTTNKSNHSFF